MAAFFGMPGNRELAGALARLTQRQAASIETRRFPDEESYVRIDEAADEASYLVCTLAHPDTQFLPLVFAAQAIRASGAKKLTLIAPYLAYLRQDRQFHAGEAVSSKVFADLLSDRFDALVTVDPHLHRYHALRDIYSVPTLVLHLAETIGAWVRENLPSPVVIGPDEESEQWVKEVAGAAGCPWALFQKERRGDRDVRLKPPDLDSFTGCTPVLIDDIISSGATMVGAAKLLRDAGFHRGFGIAVHALFADEVSTELLLLLQDLVTSDTIPNRFSRLEVAPLIANQLT